MRNALKCHLQKVWASSRAVLTAIIIGIGTLLLASDPDATAAPPEKPLVWGSPPVWGSGEYDLKSNLELNSPLSILGIRLGLTPGDTMAALKSEIPGVVPTVTMEQLLAVAGVPPYRYAKRLEYRSQSNSLVREILNLYFTSPATKNQLYLIQRETHFYSEIDYPKVGEVLQRFRVLGPPNQENSHAMSEKKGVEWWRTFDGRPLPAKSQRIGSTPGFECESDSCSNFDYSVKVNWWPTKDGTRAGRVDVEITNIFAYRLSRAADAKFVQEVRERALTDSRPGAYKP